MAAEVEQLQAENATLQALVEDQAEQLYQLRLRIRSAGLLLGEASSMAFNAPDMRQVGGGG